MDHSIDMQITVRMWHFKMVVLSVLVICIMAFIVCAKDCKTDTLGLDYTGCHAKTNDGHECSDWEFLSKTVGKDWLRDKDKASFPDLIANAGGCCRNPDKESKGLWCYYKTGDYFKEYAVGYCDVPWCSKNDGCPTFKKVSDQSKGAYLDCPLLGGGKDVKSWQTCRELACYLGGDAINYKDTECWVKSCKGDMNGYWKNTSGYNVYTTGCPSFTIAYPQSAGKSSECNSLGETHGAATVEDCKEFACSKGANTFNFKGSSCYVKLCDTESGLKLASTETGYDVYISGEYQPKTECSFDRVRTPLDRVFSICPILASITNASGEDCKKLACEKDANVLQFKDGNCKVNKCSNSNYLQLASRPYLEGWFIVKVAKIE